MIIKISPDKEKAKSIKKIVKTREEFLEKSDIKEYSTILAENYYEVIKELATAILLTEGIKSIGENAHKELIETLSKYEEIDDEEILVMQDLRIKRNKSSYEGKPINPDYLLTKKQDIKRIIGKLKKILDKKLE